MLPAVLSRFYLACLYLVSPIQKFLFLFVLSALLCPFFLGLPLLPSFSFFSPSPSLSLSLSLVILLIFSFLGHLYTYQNPS